MCTIGKRERLPNLSKDFSYVCIVEIKNSFIQDWIQLIKTYKFFDDSILNMEKHLKWAYNIIDVSMQLE